jgi:two-component system, cell cycle sensor histidine kinase and response regulator CckA
VRGRDVDPAYEVGNARLRTQASAVIAYGKGLVRCYTLVQGHVSRDHDNDANDDLDPQELRALIDVLPLATGIKNREGRWLYVNKPLAAGYGLPCDKLIGQLEQDVLPQGNDLQQSLALDREVIDSGRSLSVPGHVFCTHEGRRMILHVTREPVSFRGEPCVLVNAHDVTELSTAGSERRKLERRMAESQRLEGLGLMAGGIAHDFNNLLVGVLTNAELALRELDDSSRARGYVERVKTAAERMAGFARQMLAYSGRDHVQIAPIDLAALTRESLALLASNVPSHIFLDCSLPTTLPPVQGDATQLSQVIVNLIMNAAEAIADKPGVISVSIRREQLDNDRVSSLAVRSVRGASECLCLEVSDNGPGMDRETRNRIFDPFFSTKGQPGRGLGLASVIGIVRTHQGALQVDSELGQGTRMRVWIPLSSERERSSSAPAPAPVAMQADIRGYSVLVVDDEPLVRDTTGSVLRTHGCQVYFAADGVEAVTIADKLGHFDLVLLDMNMPGTPLRETFEALRVALPRSKVLLTSGYNDPNVLQELLQQPGTAFIQKPYVIDELLQRCASLFV